MVHLIGHCLSFSKGPSHEIVALFAFSSLFAFSFSLVSPVLSFGQDKPQIEVASLTIAKKDDKSEFGQGYSMMRSPGMEVELFFVTPKTTILSLDQEQSKISLKTNDGKELPLAEQFDGILDLNLREDGSSGLLSFKTEELPSKKTTSLSIQGTIALVAGKETKTEEITIKIVEGGKIKLGQLEVTIDSVGEAFGEPFKQSIQVSTSKPFDSIKSIEFLDDSGNAIESGEGGSGMSGFNGEYTYSKSWELASDAKSVKAKVTYFTKTETIKVPVKLDFGLGL